ncbi:MAG: LamB/YcsF family protein, partial [Phaeodactylibacter sp.]|nr:LamB/YcsF family protein [Phaeodactylibacter sp.]
LPHALLEEPEAVAEQVLSIIRQKCVYSLDGQAVPIEAQSICVHGDTPNAVGLLRHLHQALLDADIIRKAPGV